MLEWLGELLRAGETACVWTCDVYRKDEIDRSARGGVAPGCKKRCTTVGGIVFENIAEQMEQNEY